ncbi:MAG: type II toxin-antitoxin system RelB/DinJ family antitoxin [Verrucomicrobia bacterium]|nr:type II toxin-antitoxin system RelB/DinJ family antitoxin [Verrucomicrobiota bacterium]
MNKTAVVRARIEPKIKNEAEEILSQMGLKLSDAVRLLCRQIALRHALPVELKIPNRDTVEAMNEPIAKLRRYKTSDEMFKDILG